MLHAEESKFILSAEKRGNVIKPARSLFVNVFSVHLASCRNLQSVTGGSFFLDCRVFAFFQAENLRK